MGWRQLPVKLFVKYFASSEPTVWDGDFIFRRFGVKEVPCLGSEPTVWDGDKRTDIDDLVDMFWF